jgi:hypothetical protein
MRYRTVNLYAAKRLMAEIFLEGKSPDPDAVEYSTWTGIGDALDLTELEEIVAEVIDAMPAEPMGPPARDLVEGELCGHLHATIANLERTCFEALDDPGFWAYLSFKYFDQLIQWRHAESFNKYTKNPEVGLPNALKYFFDPTMKEGVLSRMYMRGHIANESGNYDLARGRNLSGGKVGNTDLWRSHVTRVRTGESPELAKAMARFWNQHEWLTTDSPGGGLRALGKLVNRRRSNIVGIVLDADESDEVIAELTGRIHRDGD